MVEHFHVCDYLHFFVVLPVHDFFTHLLLKFFLFFFPNALFTGISRCRKQSEKHIFQLGNKSKGFAFQENFNFITSHINVSVCENVCPWDVL